MNLSKERYDYLLKFYHDYLLKAGLGDNILLNVSALDRIEKFIDRKKRSPNQVALLRFIGVVNDRPASDFNKRLALSFLNEFYEMTLVNLTMYIDELTESEFESDDEKEEYLRNMEHLLKVYKK